MKEQKIQGKIIKSLETKGHVAINLITASKSGFSDIISCAPNGRFWSIEVKKPGEEPSKLQHYRLNKFRKNNAIAFWCNSVEMFEKHYKFCKDIEAALSSI